MEHNGNRFRLRITEEDVFMFILLLFVGRACSLTSLNDIRDNIPGTILLCLPALDLAKRHKVNFLNKRLFYVLLLFGIWTLLHLYFDASFKIIQYFNVFFSLGIGYIALKVYKQRIYEKVEKQLVYLTALSVVLWMITSAIGPYTVAKFGFMTPSSSTSMASFLIFNIADPVRYEGQGIAGLLRNCGFCWEPGLFSCMASIGLYFNLLVHKKFNWGTAVFLAGIFSTFSTTGYVTAVVIFANHYIYQPRHPRLSTKIIGYAGLAVVVIGMFSLSFMVDKIKNNISTESFISLSPQRLEYLEQTGQKETVQRAEGLYLDYLNFRAEPWIGYGNAVNSYVNKNISTQLITSNGLMKTFARFGLFLGLLLIGLWYFNARYIDKLFNQRYGVFFFIMLVISVSYSFTMLPLMLAMNYQVLFKKRRRKKNKRIRRNGKQTAVLNSDAVLQ